MEECYYLNQLYMLVKLKMKIRAFILTKLCQLLSCPCPAAQVVTEEKYDRRKYALSFNPSIQYLGLDDTYDFLEFIISSRSHSNYQVSPYPKAMLFRNKHQISRLDDLPSSFDDTAYENSGLHLFVPDFLCFPFLSLFLHLLWGVAAIPHRCRHLFIFPKSLHLQA